ncbi:hypothetical protein JYP52_23390 [Nitratireductor aquibiodomus]|uniref:hypothetical protein n=1 Tax=Nitratireductor aquibiodomus TaxID=204799 RepID=UPI0019D3AB8A|nr:hypothetical protein [Nitratireductor aquibiodomus]MBN7764085.1 hypothetical protein [Nitratireductor aquibiodomus]
MPREPDPANIAHQQRQRDYRKRLRSVAAPEASEVDTAIAAAVAAYANSVQSSEQKKVLTALIQGAMSILEDRGFDKKRSASVIRRRVSRHVRKDLGRLVDASRIRERLQ